MECAVIKPARWPFYIDSSHGADLRRVCINLAIMVLVMVGLGLMPVPDGLHGIGWYLPLHTLVEMLAIVVAGLIFAVGWNARLGQLPGNIVLLVCAFAGVGLFDLSHLLSFPGMPSYVTASAPEKAINFWLAARLLAASALLLASSTPWRPFGSRAVRYQLLAGVLGLTALVHWVVLFRPELVPRTFVAGQGLTAFKVWAEYLVMGLNLATAVTLLRRMRQPLSFNAAALFGAVSAMAMSELFFTWYASLDDVFNLAGHVYKIVSYLFLYQAVFLDAVDRPYRALDASQNRLKATLEAVPDLVFEMDPQGRYLEYRSPHNHLLAAPPEFFLGRSVFEVLPAPAAQVMMAALGEAQEKGLSTGRQMRLELTDGPHWFELSVARKTLLAGDPPALILLSRDITQRKALEQKLADGARHTQSILDNVVDAIITIDRKGCIASFNRAATSVFGYGAEEAIGQSVGLLMPEPERSAHGQYLHNYQTSGVKRIIGVGREVQGRRKGGDIFPMSLAVTEIERDGQPMYIGLVRDITQHRQAQAEIARLAFFDPLTDLPNRRLLLDRMARALVASERSRQLGALIFIDLDDFKTLNDTWGHEAGDQILAQVAQRLVQCVREGDTVARFGGDEFVIMLESLGQDRTAAAAHAEAVARKLLGSFGQCFALQGREHRSTPSLGITLFGDVALSADELMRRADSAMYQAKADGRNTYRFFDAQLQATLMARASLEEDLHHSLERAELHLNYQPQIDQHGCITGVEALVRWTHPVRASVSPAEFIPLAEHSGFILPLGRWVLLTACRTLAGWAASPATAALTMSVNVSARQFRDPQFVSQVLEASLQTGASLAHLKLELTESVLVDDLEDIIDKMTLLRARGVRFSLDDFGTGFSSLSYIKRLPLDQLKIDQSFVRDVLTDPNDAAIARTVVALGQTLGLSVIAEGVETAGQRDFLAQNGCLAFQGYFFSRPLPAEQLDQFIRSRLPAQAQV